MNRQEARSLGGRVMAKRQRDEALEKYYANPSRCLNCEQIIEVKAHEQVAITRTKKFCSRSCSASYNNPRRAKRLRPKKHKVCTSCSRKADSRSGLCLGCYHLSLFDIFGQTTKADLFDKRSGYQSARSSIRNHAVSVYARSGKSTDCAICGYDVHTEVCHKHPVKDFPGTALLSEINHLDNLIALCPNHHWELDHGFLALGE